MPKYNVSVIATVYADYTVTADTAEDAKELAEQAFVDDDIFETLAAVQDGRLVKDDQGIVSIKPDEVAIFEVEDPFD
jgi:DNA-binding LytR/AlgR family response regulator